MCRSSLTPFLISTGLLASLVPSTARTPSPGPFDDPDYEADPDELDFEFPDDDFGLAALFGDDPNFQPVPKVRFVTKRETAQQYADRQAAEGVDPNLAKRMIEDSLQLMPYSVSTSIRTLLLMVDVAEWVAVSKKKNKGRELVKKGISSK